jgi:VCBS repeat-containing protein
MPKTPPIALLFVVALVPAQTLANNPPDARDVTFETDEDNPLEDVLEASDVDNDPLTFRVDRPPRKGELKLDDNGHFVYQPRKNFHGSDEFRFRVSDGKKDVARKAVIHVKAVNDAPTAGPPVSARGREDGSARGQVTGKDIDGDRVSFEVGRRPQHGSVEVDARRGRFTYTPADNFNGTDKFVIDVTDDDGASAGVPVTVTIDPVNDPPTANDSNARGREEMPIRGKVSARDIDKQKLTFTVSKPAANGKVEMDAATGSWVYTPKPNYNGEDEFSFEASDGSARAKGTVTLRVDSVNDAPSTKPLSVEGKEDTPLKAKIPAKDPDGDKLRFVPALKPRKGELKLNRATGEFTYTPFLDFHGKDKFSVDVSDRDVSKTSFVTVVIASVNDLPESVPATGAGEEDGAVRGRLEASDVDNDKLSFKLSKPPRNGTATVKADGSYSYKPKPNWSGDDAFQFEISDGKGVSKGDALLSIAPVNDAPTAKAVNVSTREESAARGRVEAEDIDRDPLSFKLGKRATKGKASVDATRGTFTYTPDKDANGEDSFEVIVSDGKAEGRATVSVAIAPVNDAPVAEDAAGTGSEDQKIEGMANATDIDRDKLSYSVATRPRSGTVTIAADTGSFTYTPKPHFFGNDSFTFQVSDGKAKDTGVVKLTVASVNDVPEPKPAQVKATEDRPAAGRVEASDIDRDKLTWSIALQPSKGKVDLDAARGSFKYTPDKDANGDDSFTVKVSDGKSSKDAKVSVAIAPVNDAPVAEDASGSGDEDNKISGTVRASDVDKDRLTYAVANKPRNGTVTIDGGTGAFSYSPKPHYNGDDAFTFQVSDGKAKDTGAVKLKIAAVNDVPEPKPAQVRTSEDRAATGRVEASDIDRDKLTWSIASRSSKGKVKLDAARGTFTYTPNDDANGDDSFTVKVSDGKSSKDAKVSVTIAPVNDTPVASATSARGDEDTTLTGTVSATDVDKDRLTYSVATRPRNGDVTVDPGSGAFRYTPKPHYNGPDGFTFQASDGRAKATAAVKLTVVSVNDTPQPTDANITTAEDRAGGARVAATDIDRDVLTFALQSPPSKGTATVDDRAGAVRYEPHADVHGTDSFVVRVSDGRATADATVRVTVTPQPDAPVVNAAPVETKEDQPVTVRLAAHDADGDRVTYRVVTQSGLGKAQVEGDGTSLRFSPSKDAHGESELVVEASDGRNRARGALAVRVAPQNDAPTLDAVKAKTNEETPVRLTVRARDRDGDAVKVELGQRPRGADVTLDGRLLTVTPKRDVTGKLEIGLIATDPHGGRAEGKAIVEVVNVNDPPTAKGKRLSARPGARTLGTIEASDVDKDTLTFSIAVPPKKGSAVIEDPRSGAFVYTGKEGAKGTDSFRVRVTDQARASVTVTVTVTLGG